MKKDRIITLLGILVVFVPMLGIPGDYKTIVFVALGLSIILLSIDKKGSLHVNSQNEEHKPTNII